MQYSHMNSHNCIVFRTICTNIARTVINLKSSELFLKIWPIFQQGDIELDGLGDTFAWDGVKEEIIEKGKEVDWDAPEEAMFGLDMVA